MAFTSRHNKLCAYSNIEQTNATNPCWTGDTKVWTVNGPVSFVNLATSGEAVDVLSQDSDGKLCVRTMRNPRKTRESAEIVSIKLDDGTVLRCTPDHNVYLRNGKKVRAIDLVPGDSVMSKSPLAVVSVFALDYTEDVYNGTVDETSRYFVMCGEDNAILSANCGEQFLPARGSCNLGSINIAAVPEHELGFVATVGTLFLDFVIDINHFPLKEIGDVNLFYRDIGLGAMGVHDYLIDRGLRYDSQEGRIAIAKVLGTITETAYRTSATLANLYGQAPAYKDSRFAIDPDYVPIAMLYLDALAETNTGLQETFRDIRKTGLRNMSVTTIAPTGTISNIAETSSGIEPNFMMSYTRWMSAKTGERVPLIWTHGIIQDMDLSPEELDTVLQTGSLYAVTGDDVLRNAQEIDPKDHLLMQTFAQAYISNSISKTINLPQTATIEDVERIFELAMRLGVKGATVYRDHSLEVQVLQSNDSKQEEPQPAPSLMFFSDIPDPNPSKNCPECHV
jgi:ribonucleotide reductase alpha subunit